VSDDGDHSVWCGGWVLGRNGMEMGGWWWSFFNGGGAEAIKGSDKCEAMGAGRRFGLAGRGMAASPVWWCCW